MNEDLQSPMKFRGKPVKRVHVMVKPIGPACNLDCTYCYYLSKQDLLDTAANHAISDEMLETFIQQYFESNNSNEVVFSWQGGEPTLLGIDFFRRVVELQKKHAPPHVRVENDLQTNGTLLNNEWCKFLHEENFLVGLSIDGPKDLHDAFRTYRDGKGSFDKVFQAARRLKKHKVNFATLTCINRETAKHPLKVYRFLRDQVGSKRIQFIPIVEPKVFRDTAPQYWDKNTLPVMGTPEALPGTPNSIVEDWSVDPDDWGTFLCTVFDEWYKKDIGQLYIHYFEACVETWMGRVAPLCTHGPMCGKGLALERDGSLYACDHYVYPEYSLGNIGEQPLEHMAFSAQQEHFGRMKEGSLPDFCRQCEFQFTCFGECPKNRFIKTPDGQPGLNYLCSGWKKFYTHIDKPMQDIVKVIGGTVQKGLRTQSASPHWVPEKQD